MQNRYSEYHQIINLYASGLLRGQDELLPELIGERPITADDDRSIKLRAAFIKVLNEELDELPTPISPC